MPVKVWINEGRVYLRDWNDQVEVRAASGQIQLSHIKADWVSLLCPHCECEVSQIRGDLRVLHHDRKVKVSQVKGKNVFVETQRGAVSLADVEADLMLVIRDGQLNGERLKGEVQFSSLSGSVFLSEIEGVVSGRSISGNLEVSLKRWSGEEKMNLESVSGRVKLEVPASFDGEVDAWSVLGRARVDWELKFPVDLGVYGPEPRNHIRGMIGKSNSGVRLFSRSGDVTLLPIFIRGVRSE
jgi:DUF4097 and DUF4098 domain-containing protein YvlB